MEILAAAERIFLAYGYEGATIRRIADEVGVSPTALYMHFPDKHAMLMEIGADALRRLMLEARAIAEETDDAAGRLRRLLQGLIAFALANPTAYRIVFCEGARDAARAAAGDKLGQDFYAVLVGVTGELAAAGRLLGRGDPEVSAQVLFAACHGLIASLILNAAFEHAPADALVQAMLDGLMRGYVASKAA